MASDEDGDDAQAVAVRGGNWKPSASLARLRPRAFSEKEDGAVLTPFPRSAHHGGVPGRGAAMDSESVLLLLGSDRIQRKEERRSARKKGGRRKVAAGKEEG